MMYEWIAYGWKAPYPRNTNKLMATVETAMLEQADAVKETLIVSLLDCGILNEKEEELVLTLTPTQRNCVIKARRCLAKMLVDSHEPMLQKHFGLPGPETIRATLNAVEEVVI
jgi:hypothetical protein